MHFQITNSENKPEATNILTHFKDDLIIVLNNKRGMHK